MSTATQIPAGTWKSDHTHSEAAFSLRHVVSTFRGRFAGVEATLVADADGSLRLDGAVRADSIVVKDENLQAHLGSPEFFDIEQYPEITFTSSRVDLDGSQVTIEGELTIKGHTHPLKAAGTITEPVESPFGQTTLGLQVETTIDRTQYGLDWNAPLPKGGNMLSDEVTLAVDLELVHQA
jgi:polyisoprenoid-binding protein YceI